MNGLLAAMAASPSAEPEALLKHLSGEIDGFVGNAPQFDDITMLAFRVNDGTEPEKQTRADASGERTETATAETARGDETEEIEEFSF